MLDCELFAILACPECKQALEDAADDLVVEINQRIKSGAARTRSGKKIGAVVESALLCKRDNYAFPVREGIPLLLIDESISLCGLPS